MQGSAGVGIYLVLRLDVDGAEMDTLFRLDHGGEPFNMPKLSPSTEPAAKSDAPPAASAPENNPPAPAQDAPRP